MLYAHVSLLRYTLACAYSEYSNHSARPHSTNRVIVFCLNKGLTLEVGKVSTNFAAAKNGKVGSNFSAAKNGQVSSSSKKR